MKNGMEYNLIRSNRKTLSVEITDEGDVLVRAPKWSPKCEIDAFVESHRAWIKKNQEKMALKYLETAWTTKLTKEEIDELKETALEDIKARIDKWAPIVAPDSRWANKDAEIPEQLSIWDILSIDMPFGKSGQKSKEKPDSPSITIGRQKTLWGSCDAAGNLRFNCLLMLAPEEVRDYVVVHELCHLKHMDHSRAFWRAVERALPNYRKQKNWLKENGHTLLARLG